MKLPKYRGALCCRPAGDRDLASVTGELLASGFPEIPESYAQFLRASDGYAWNGYEFYGTRRCVQDGEGGFVLNDIVSANRQFRIQYEIEGKLLLGRWDISYYTFNAQTGKYEELESDSREVMQEFDTFEALFKAQITGY